MNPTDPTGPRGNPETAAPLGVRHLASDTYRQWVTVACVFAALGYGASFLATFLTLGWVEPWVRITELGTLAAALVGLLLARRGFVDAAALLAVSLLWVQTHLGMFLTGEVGRPGVLVLPALVIAGGILVGRRAAWGLAVTSSLTTFVAAASGYAMGFRRPEASLPPASDPRQIVFAITLAAVLVAIAAILHSALSAFESALREARDSSFRLRRLVADAPDGILSLDAEGRVATANPQAAAIFSRSLPTLSDAPFAGLFGPDQRVTVEHWLARGAGEMLHLRTSTRVLEATGRQLTGADGGTETRIILRDVSERETASELAAELSRVLHETPAEIVIFKGGDGSIVLTSRGLRSNLGYREAHLGGTPVSHIAPRLADEALATLVRRLRGAPGTLVRAAGVHRRRDGSVYPVETEYALGELLGETVVIGFVNDMTRETAARREHEDLQRKLQHAQKMEAIGHLAGGVAHDFNNLLTVVGGCAEILLDEARGETRELVEEIVRARDRGQELTRGLLTFARRDVVQPRVVHLEELVPPALVLIRRLVGEKIEVTYEAPHGLPPVRVDPGQVEQILMNLAANARDAMPGGGHLTLELKEGRSGESVVLAVSDDGVGMDAEVREHIFEPFFTTKPIGSGTGLGLAMVQGIVAQSDATIEVESSPDEGTRFTIEWPATEPGEPADVEVSQQPGGPVKPVELLYVEDFAETRSLVARLLSRAGHSVHQAESAEAALALPPELLAGLDIVVTDVVMPGISGIAMVEELRRRGVQVPVLFVSGYLDETIHGTVPDDGRHDLLLKPFSGAELNERIGALVSGTAGS